MNKKLLAIFFAILAAGLYAINIPLSKLLLNYIFKEKPTLGYFLGLTIMILGTVIVVIDTLTKKHTHTISIP